MKNNVKPRRSLWIAVRVERGFVEEARLFASEKEAMRTAAKWRGAGNPDYDEVGVIRSTLPNGPASFAAPRSTPTRARSRTARDSV